MLARAKPGHIHYWLDGSGSGGKYPARGQPHLSVSGVVEAGVSGEDQQSAGVAAPPDLLLTHDRLHDGVKAALRRVQVPGDLGLAHLPLQGQVRSGQVSRRSSGGDGSRGGGGRGSDGEKWKEEMGREGSGGYRKTK